MEISAAFYGRFSTDRQRETSIADQERVCDVRATAIGFRIVVRHTDEGVSGSTPVAARPGGKQLLADALAGRFEVLLVEGLGRLSRDMVEQERVIRRLEHRGIRIVGVLDGYDSDSSARKLHRGMRGLINEVYLDDLRAKTHRGLAGQVSRGMHAGGLSFGYRTVPVEGGNRLEVNQEQAGWVRWIFEKYANHGWSVQRIAHELNRLKVPALRGGTWSVSVVYGHPQRGSGILNNTLYIGKYIWNRSQWMKDPDTGKRVRIDRPVEEWITQDLPELQIVSDEAWERAKERMTRTRAQGGPGRAPITRTLMSGVLKCGVCGGPIIAWNKVMYGCSIRKDRGRAVCTGVSVNRDKVDDLVLGIVRDEILTPEAIDELEQEVRRLMSVQRRESVQAQADTQRKIEASQAEIDRLIDAIAQVGISPALASRLQAAESELAVLQAPSQERQQPELKMRSMANIVARYRTMLENLDEILATDLDRAKELLREILGQPVIEKDAEGHVWVTLDKEKASMLSHEADSTFGCGGRI